MSQASRVIAVVSAWVLTGLGLLGVLGYLYSAGNPVTLAVSALAPYLMAVALVALALFAIVRQWLPGLLALAIVVFLVVVQAPSWTSSAPPRGDTEMVVMTANLRIGAADADAVVREVKARDVDVLMVQELTPQAESRLREAGLDTALPYHLSEPAPEAARGTGLWSRYRLTPVDWPQLAFNRIVARAAVPGMANPPIVIALHVAGPVPNSINWGLDLKRLPGMLRDLPRDAPVVVGGDFNATRSVAQFRGLLGGGYQDAADQAGAGLARTYPSDTWFPPVLGIDHVLTRGGVASDVDTVTITGSDHRALVARLTLDDTR